MMSQVQRSEHIVFRSSNGNIHELYWKPGIGWKHNNLSQILGVVQAVGRPAGYAWNRNNTEHIIYRGVDNHIHELYWRSGVNWQHAALTQVLNAPPASSEPTGYAWENNNTEHIAYCDSRSHIIELYFKHGIGWNFADLTAATGAPPAASKPAGYSFESNGTEHIVYRGHDGGIYELYFRHQKGWNVGALTKATNAPPAIGNPIGYAWENNRSEHIIYRGTDNSIYELYWKPGVGWNYSDLTKATRAPPADSNPSGYAWDTNSSEHIAYRGTDNHVHELYFKPGKGWNHADLTAAIGAPLASKDPTGYAFESNNTEHIAFRDHEGKICELYFRIGVGWNKSDLTAATGSPLADSSPVGYPFH